MVQWAWHDPDGRIAVSEGFRPIRCQNCGGTVMAPTGPGFWHPATGGRIRSRRGVHCACGYVIWEIGLDDLLWETGLDGLLA